MGIFEIEERDGAARTGSLTTAHGRVATPAFIPLATRGSVKAMLPGEIEELGFEMVLGNTLHLFLMPGAEAMARFGGLHRFMSWERALITDSGGFQIFSMGHGGVADEIKGRGRSAEATGSQGAVLRIDEDGVVFRSYIDGSEQFMGPETSMQMQAAIGSDIALVLDECTPFHAERSYTQRSMERTHRWLGRCLKWHGEHGPRDQAIFGIVQGGVYQDLRAQSAEAVSSAAIDGVAIGGSLGQGKEQMYEVVEWSLRGLPDHLPRHLLGIGEVDDLLTGVALGIDLFDCAMPTRLARHGVALVPNPDSRWRLDLTKSSDRYSDRPILEGCRCNSCTHHSCAYLSYLLKAHEITAIRLLTEHNLYFISKLMEGLRSAVVREELGAYSAAIRAGKGPDQVADAT